MIGMRVSIAEAAGKPNKASTWQGGKMKKVLAISPCIFTTISVAIAVLAMLLAPARTTTVHVVRYIPAGGTVWGAVESAMAETGDTRPVDKVEMYGWVLCGR